MTRSDDLYAKFERTQAEYIDVLRRFRDTTLGLAAYKVQHGILPPNTQERLDGIKREMARLHIRLLRLRADYMEAQLAEGSDIKDLTVPDYLPDDL